MPEISRPQIVRMRHLPALVGLSRAQIYRLVKAGEFPAPIKLSKATTGWRDSDIQEWIDSRPVVEWPSRTCTL